MINRKLVVLFLIMLGTILVSPIFLFAADPAFEAPDIVIRIPGMEDFSSPTPVSCPTNLDSEIFSGCYSFPWIGEYIRNLYVFAVYAVTIVAGTSDGATIESTFTITPAAAAADQVAGTYTTTLDVTVSAL